MVVRTSADVLAALGKPDETQDIEGLGRMWYYGGVAVDPVTGHKSRAQLVFGGDAVEAVNFD